MGDLSKYMIGADDLLEIVNLVFEPITHNKLTVVDGRGEYVLIGVHHKGEPEPETIETKILSDSLAWLDNSNRFYIERESNDN